MDLKKKLAYYKQPSQSQQPQDTETKPPPSLVALKEIFNAAISRPEAPFLKIEIPYQLNRFSPLPTAVKSGPATRYPHEEIPLDRCLFFDLETTGLAGGAGTFAFLIGFAFFQEERLMVRQYFLPDYGREYHVFVELSGFFTRFEYLISFNGKSYDFPLLRTRFILNRQPFALEDFHHIDLLHPVRRLWKDSFPSCDLGTIERELLDRRRQGDIPGALIPHAYFKFLQTGVIHDMKRVIEHNALDLLSLAELFLLFNRIENQPHLLDDAALTRLLKLMFQNDDWQEFDRLCKILSLRTDRLPDQVRVWQSLLHKRRAEWPQAVRLWDELTSSREHLFFALEELAKFYEHRKKDWPKALAYTERALNHLHTIAQLDPYRVDGKLVENFRQRRRRLLEKLGKKA